VKFNDVCSESSTYGAYSTMTFEVSDGMPLSKKRRDRWELGSRIVDTGRSSVFRDCLERVYCEILLPIILHLFSPQHQRRAPLSPILFPGVAPSASFLPHRSLLFRARCARRFFHIAAGSRANARKEIKSTLMVFAISRHCERNATFVNTALNGEFSPGF